MCQTQPGKGLQLLLIGKGIAFLVGVVGLFGGSGGLLDLVGLVLMLVALYQLRPSHRSYGTAFDLNIAAFVVALAGSVLAVIVGIVPFLGVMAAGLIVVVMAVISAAIGYLVVRNICTATSELAANMGDVDTAALGDLLVKGYLLCVVVSVVCSVLSIIPLLGVIFGLLAKLSDLALMAANGLMVYFLYKAMKLFA